MDRPTAEEIRLDTRIDWVAIGYPDTVAGNALLDEEIAFAWAYVESKSCRDLDALVVDDPLGILGLRALKLRVLQSTTQSSSSYVNQSLNNLIKSFAVPGYSETKFDPPWVNNKNFQHAVVNDWPVLADLLWMMMTDECKQFYIDMFKDEFAPFSVTTEVMWWNH